MPVRPPNHNPPFNVVRVSHVELGVRDLAKSRGFYVDCLGYLVTDEQRDALYLRAVEERNHHSIVLSPNRRALRAGDRLQARQRRGPRPRRLLFRAQGLADVVSRRALSGPHAAHGRSAGHAARLLCAHGPGRLHDPQLRGISRRAHPAHRSRQLLHARCAGVLRFLHRHRIQADRIHRDRRSRCEAVGGVDAPQRQRARPRLHQRHRPAPPPHRRVDGGRARHSAHLRRDGLLRLSRQYGARAGPPRHFQCVLSLYARSRRPPRRTVHLRLSHRRSRT